MMENLANTLEKDKEMQNWIYNAYFYSSPVRSNPIDFFLSEQDWAEKFDPVKFFIAPIRNNTESTAKELAKNNFTWETVSTKNNIISITIKTDEDVYFIYENGIDKKGNRELIYLNDLYMVNEYKKEKNRTKGIFKATDSWTWWDDHSTRFEVEYNVTANKKSELGIPHGTYDISFEGENIDLEVSPDRKGSIHEIKIAGVNLLAHTSKKTLPKARPVIKRIFPTMTWKSISISVLNSPKILLIISRT